MSRLELHMQCELVKAGVVQALEPVEAETMQVALRQNHQERLERLFRRVGDSADDRYLIDVMRRYRGIEPS